MHLEPEVPRKLTNSVIDFFYSLLSFSIAFSIDIHDGLPISAIDFVFVAAIADRWHREPLESTVGTVNPFVQGDGATPVPLWHRGL